MGSDDLIYLKQAINKNSELVKESIRTNRILTISNLILAGILTYEDALKDEEFKDFIQPMKNNNAIKAHVRK